jgi:hypothetical protein
MHLAYIISAYKYPLQLIRLIQRLNTSSSSFFVHIDKKTDQRTYDEIMAGLRQHSNVHFIKRHQCEWGGFGHVAATLKGIAEISRTGTSADYVILLTGQDYPIKSNDRIYRFFQEHNGRLFLEFFSLPTQLWQNRGVVGGLERIEAWHWRVFKRHFYFPSKPSFPFKRQFPKGFRPFGGSSYWCVPRECVEYIHELAQKNRGFINFFKYVDVPDEILFHTIILNSPFAPMVVNDDLRYVEWPDPSAGSPAILRTADFGKLASSPKLFARKFDATLDEKVLDLIDRTLLA